MRTELFVAKPMLEQYKEQRFCNLPVCSSCLLLLPVEKKGIRIKYRRKVISRMFSLKEINLDVDILKDAISKTGFTTFIP